MADATKKKHIRGGHKAFCTSLSKKFTSLLSSIRQKSKQSLKNEKIVLTEKLETLNKLDGEIVELVKEEKIDGEFNKAGNFRATIHQAIVKIDNTLKRAAEAEGQHASKNGNSHEGIAGTFSAQASKTTKLPKLTIKKFTGLAHEYQGFWDSIRTAVHENPNLSDIDRVNYLRSYLEGPPYAAINSFPSTGTNYHNAIELLQE